MTEQHNYFTFWWKTYRWNKLLFVLVLSFSNSACAVFVSSCNHDARRAPELNGRVVLSTNDFVFACGVYRNVKSAKCIVTRCGWGRCLSHSKVLFEKAAPDREQIQTLLGDQRAACGPTGRDGLVCRVATGQCLIEVCGGTCSWWGRDDCSSRAKRVVNHAVCIGCGFDVHYLF